GAACDDRICDACGDVRKRLQRRRIGEIRVDEVAAIADLGGGDGQCETCKADENRTERHGGVPLDLELPDWSGPPGGRVEIASLEDFFHTELPRIQRQTATATLESTMPPTRPMERRLDS